MLVSLHLAVASTGSSSENSSSRILPSPQGSSGGSVVSKYFDVPGISTLAGPKMVPPCARLLTSSEAVAILDEKERKKQQEVEEKEQKKEREEKRKNREKRNVNEKLTRELGMQTRKQKRKLRRRQVRSRKLVRSTMSRRMLVSGPSVLWGKCSHHSRKRYALRQCSRWTTLTIVSAACASPHTRTSETSLVRIGSPAPVGCGYTRTVLKLCCR